MKDWYPHARRSRFDRVAFGSHRDLVGMKVVDPQFVQQRLFDNLVGEQKRFDPDRFQ